MCMCVYMCVTVFENERHLPLLLLLPLLVLMLMEFVPASKMSIMTTGNHSHETRMHTEKARESSV